MSLFKLLFPKEYNKKVKLIKEIISLRKEPRDFLAPLDFADVDEDGKPPHFLKGLTEAERKNFISNMEVIWNDEKFHTVINYVINVVGNYSFQKEPDETKIARGRYAVVGIRTLVSEFNNMHNEFQESRKQPDEFDKFEVL